MAVMLGARCREELHARGCHPRVRGVEVLDMEEETHPPGGLLPDDGGLVFAVSPREQQAGRGTPVAGLPPTAWDAPSLVRAGESSTSSKPSTSTKKLMAGSYSLTTMAMRPRCTSPA